MTDSAIGRRIAVVGNTAAGKSTLGERLATALGAPFVDLDALNWKPGWIARVDTEPEEFSRLIAEATSGEGWVVAGSYSTFTRPAVWPRLDTIVWLDLPLRMLIARLLVRSWRRWRSRELLWGTNTESFVKHLKVWHPDSLIWWACHTQEEKRVRRVAEYTDPSLTHVRTVRLVSPSEVEAFTRSIEAQLGAGSVRPRSAASTASPRGESR